MDVVRIRTHGGRRYHLLDAVARVEHVVQSGIEDLDHREEDQNQDPISDPDVQRGRGEVLEVEMKSVKAIE